MFSDHNHLWFDPNWKRVSSSLSASNNRQLNVGRSHNNEDEDPMAAMLENNAKNKNATNIFINQLHNIKPNPNNDTDNGAPEYAEVDGLVDTKQNILMADINQGPYATTTLVQPPRFCSMSGQLNHTVSNSYLILACRLF